MHQNERIVVLNDAIFGRTGQFHHVWRDGYDWVDAIDTHMAGVGIAADRLFHVIREIYKNAPENTVIWNFGQDLAEEVAKRSYVSEMDAEIFLDDLKIDIVDALPGLPGVGFEYDASILLDTYGAISRRFPNFNIVPTLVERIKEVFSPPPSATPKDVAEAAIASMSRHLDLANEIGVVIEVKRLNAFARMADEIEDMIARGQADPVWELNDLRDQINKASVPNMASALAV